MHVLIVIAHPRQNSFTHAVAGRFRQGVEAEGHDCELADLHAEGFDPRWSVEDDAQFEGRPMPQDILSEQARVERADVIAMTFPLYWWGMPAMMKGWLDRVWSWGWAYDQVDDPEKSLQRPRTGVMLIPAGASPGKMDEHGYREAMRTVWHVGTMGYLGMTQRDVHLLHGSQGSEKRRLDLLDQAEAIGRALQLPGA